MAEQDDMLITLAPQLFNKVAREQSTVVLDSEIAIVTKIQLTTS
jgi:hypothetical protein